MYGITAIVPAWCQMLVYAAATTFVSAIPATTTRRLRGCIVANTAPALASDALMHGNKNLNSLCAAIEYPTIVQNVTINASGHVARCRQNPTSASGVIVPITAGYPCVTYQCHGCEPYSALPLLNTLNLTKLHTTHVHSP